MEAVGTTEKTEKLSRIISVVKEAQLCEELYRGTKLAAFCALFIEFNTPLIEAYNKNLENRTKKLLQDHELYKIQFALIGENEMILKNPDGSYKFNAAGEAEILKNAHAVNDQVSQTIDELLKGEGTVICILEELPINPEKVPYKTEKLLNGFVFCNKNVDYKEL